MLAKKICLQKINMYAIKQKIAEMLAKNNYVQKIIMFTKTKYVCKN